ncbi:MAG: FAD-dependent oxidoreductase [Clostridiales Family XIII bacterium]|nr:FAD-dependent oxidoreductase [Clostridiales Family XIII bacterium]
MIEYDVDVLVVGGGCAGVAAGVAASRRGLRTLLIENMNNLGGIMTNGYVPGVAGMIEGVCKELLDRLDKNGKLFDTPHTPAVDPEYCKFEMENMLLSSGCRILYGTRAVDAIMDGSDIKSVVCYSKSGRMEIKANLFIDATGDADIAAFSGVPYEVGNSEYMGLNLAHTLGLRMGGVNMKAFRTANKAWVEDNKGYPENMCYAGECMDKAVAAGDLPYPLFPGGLIYQVPGTDDENADITFCVGHSFYNHNLDVEDLSRQLVEQHRQSLWLENVFRKYVQGFENCRITGVGSLPGIRDSRRIVGEYVYKDTDIAAARKFDDSIAKFPEIYDSHHPTSGYWGFRHHALSKEKIPAGINIPADPNDKAMYPFAVPDEGDWAVYSNPTEYSEVPYRCIVPLKVDNLFVAGRCVSTEFHAMAAVRIISICMSTGQAAGVAADLCLKAGITPRELDGRTVRDEMIKDGVPLDKAPDGYWAFLAHAAEEDAGQNEYVRLRGDMMGVKLPDGKITMRFGFSDKKEDLAIETRPDDWEPETVM